MLENLDIFFLVWICYGVKKLLFQPEVFTGKFSQYFRINRRLKNDREKLIGVDRRVPPDTGFPSYVNKILYWIVLVFCAMLFVAVGPCPELKFPSGKK
jgi:hypothetical protein